jgi:hypothetical protein
VKERVKWDKDHKAKETDKEEPHTVELKVIAKVTKMDTRNVDVDQEEEEEVEEEKEARARMAVIVVETKTRYYKLRKYINQQSFL